MGKYFRVRLFGAFKITRNNGAEIKISSVRAKALIALLLTAPDAKHTRKWLQDMLWSRSGPEQRAQSFRRLLSDIRRVFEDDFDFLFETTNHEVSINSDNVEIVGCTGEGIFLEGLASNEPKLQTWLTEKRALGSDSRLKLPSVFSGNVKPALAVIPFTPFVDAPFEREIGDLLALELTRVLSRSHLFEVTSHLSSRRFQFAQLDLSEIRRVLNVDYLLYGNLRANNGNLDVHGDLIDLSNEQLIWSHKYETSANQILTQQDRVSFELASDVSRSIAKSSLQTLNKAPTQHLSSYIILMSAITLMHGYQRDGFAKAKLLLEELIHRTPNTAILHAWLGKWYVLKSNMGLSSDTQEDANRANQCTDMALQIDPTCPFSLTIDGLVKSNLLRRFDVATEQWELALDHEPSNAIAWLLKGTMHAFTDEGEIAVNCTSKSRNLSPLDPHRYYFDCLSATAHLANEDYTSAERLAQRSYKQNKFHISTLRVRTIALQGIGRTTEAQASAKELLAKDPSFSVDSYLRFHPAADFSTGQTWAGLLREAGIPQS